MRPFTDQLDPDDVLEEAVMALPAERQEAVRAAYRRRAKNATAAFLTCYFLGVFGVHRMYLGQWGRALLNLILPLLALGGALLLSAAGVPGRLILVGLGVLVVIGLIWEAIELARLDRETHARNLALARRLAARARELPGAGEAALWERQPGAGAEAMGAIGGFGAITAEDIAQARTWADEVPTDAAVPGALAVAGGARAWDDAEDSAESATQPDLRAVRGRAASRPAEPAALSQAQPSQPSQPSQTRMKRIRVKRKILLDGEVVGEQVIEELVPIDVDTQVAAAALQRRLAHMTPEQIAAMAHLPPDVAVEFREPH
jgi:TM2 domain-containing membrane protein YozV